MKRALSILLAALLLLVAVPTVAEESTLKAGLYVSDAGTEYMYLNEEGVGVLNYKSDQYYANGVVWTETSLEIEREAVPYALADGVLSFTYDGIDMALRYSGVWDAFALGDQGDMAFAGEYVAENGKNLTLAADGHGSYDGEDVFWGTLLPYWREIEGVTSADCFVLFGSYLGGMSFADGVATVEIKNRFYVGDTLELLSPAGVFSFPVTAITRADTGEAVDTVSIAGQRVLVPLPHSAQAGDFLRGPNRNHQGG